MILLSSNIWKEKYFEGYANDIFDDYTRTAVINFQKVNGLKADGIVNWDMWDMLLSSNAKPMPKSDTE